MKRKATLIACLIVLLIPAMVHAQGESKASAEDDAPVITISEDIDKAVVQEASKVKEEFENRFESLTVRKPFSWNADTIVFISSWGAALPSRIPEFLRAIASHSRVLGILGTLALILFLATLLYSVIWQKRLLSKIEVKTQHVGKLLSERQYPYFIAIVDVITSILVPLLLLALYALFGGFFEYQSDWFLYTGRLLWLWLGTAAISRLFRQLLTNKDVTLAARSQGPAVYRWVHFLILYSAAMIAVYWLVKIFHVRGDVIDLLSFFASISISFLFLLLSLKKKAVFAVLPQFENPIYKSLYRFIRYFYYPLVLATLSGALLWAFGYQELGLIILRKIWLTTFAFLAIALTHHVITSLLERWLRKQPAPQEHAAKLVHTTKMILLYATILASFFVILNLLGLLDPLQRIMSFPLMDIGDSTIRFWTILKAISIILAFSFTANLLQSYLDFRIYPSLGVDPGLGLILNTTIRYLLIGIAIFIALHMIGINFKVLLVFAGAIGIGIGLGLQSLASNIISGLIIIFGRKIRKGDWIEEEGRLGQVSDIYLRATKLKTRDNIEYLVPNSNLTARTIINYSYSSPLVRIHLPVGVSYKSNPKHVKEILLDVASRNDVTSQSNEPVVRFMEYADSSLNFELLVWIDVRTTPAEDAKSSLYFTLFEEFQKHGIEIPFPQRDIHIK